MDRQQDGGAPPQYSPDGKWWWDGSKWVAVEQPATSAPVGLSPTSGATARARLPHQTRRFWIGLGVLVLALTGIGVCFAAVPLHSNPAGSVAVATPTEQQTTAPTSTPTPASTPRPSPTLTPTPLPAPTAAPPVAAAPPPTAAPAKLAGCYPLSNSGTCYEPGEFCRTADHGRTGVAGNGEAIVCEYNNGWRWEPA
jgi:hypothetical protein